MIVMNRKLIKIPFWLNTMLPCYIYQKITSSKNLIANDFAIMIFAII